MDKVIVIFDTNTIRSIGINDFLGNRDELRKFSDVAQIILPSIVVEEIKSQKNRVLKDKKDKFCKNPFYKIYNLDKKEEKISIDDVIVNVETKEALKYTTIELKDYSIIEKMKKLALEKLPPFEANDNTDKGFKDAYIYFTILEFAQSISDKMIFVCTGDGRLTEALNQHENIQVISDYAEFVSKNINLMCDDYFIGRLNEELVGTIIGKNILDYWININDNYVFLIKTQDREYVVEMELGEVVLYTEKKLYYNDIDKLINSNEFDTSRVMVDNLNSHVGFLSGNEIVKILEATRINENIYRIISEDSTKQFIGALYDNKKEDLEEELREYIGELLDSKGE